MAAGRCNRRAGSVQPPPLTISTMMIRRGSLALATLASLVIFVWAPPAQATETVTVGLPVSQWAYANSTNTNWTMIDPFVAAGDPSPAAAILYAGHDSVNGRTFRGFMRFGLSGISGQVVSAQITGRVDHTWSCAARPTSFFRTAPITTTPRQSWPGPALQLKLANDNVFANEAACAQPNMSFGVGGATLTMDLQTAVDGGSPYYFVGISAADNTGGLNETAADRWMRYFLNDFRLVVTYTTA